MFWAVDEQTGCYSGREVRLPVTCVRGIKLRLFAFSSVAASHDSFAAGLRSGRPIFVLPLLRENKTPGCPIVVVTGAGTARDFPPSHAPTSAVSSPVTRATSRAVPRTLQDHRAFPSNGILPDLADFYGSAIRRAVRVGVRRSRPSLA